MGYIINEHEKKHAKHLAIYSITHSTKLVRNLLSSSENSFHQSASLRVASESLPTKASPISKRSLLVRPTTKFGTNNKHNRDCIKTMGENEDKFDIKNCCFYPLRCVDNSNNKKLFYYCCPDSCKFKCKGTNQEEESKLIKKSIRNQQPINNHNKCSEKQVQFKHKETIQEISNNLIVNDDRDVDAGYAWIILITMFFINASTFGTSRAYGLIFEKLARSGHYTRAEASLPFAISGAIENMGGMLTCILVSKTSWRLVVFIGTLLTTIGHLMAYFTRTIMMNVLTIGLLCGLGTSFISIPFFQINNAYFVKYRTTAFGASLAGAAVGIYYVSPVCEYTLEHYSAHTCYLVLSVILFPNVPLSLLLKPKLKTPLIPQPTVLSKLSVVHGTIINDNDDKQQPINNGESVVNKDHHHKCICSEDHYIDQQYDNTIRQQQQQQVHLDNSMNSLNPSRCCSYDLSFHPELSYDYSTRSTNDLLRSTATTAIEPISYSFMSRVRTKSNCSITFAQIDLADNNRLNSKQKKQSQTANSFCQLCGVGRGPIKNSEQHKISSTFDWLWSWLLKKKIYTIPDTKPGRYIPIMQFDCHIGFATDYAQKQQRHTSSIKGCFLGVKDSRSSVNSNDVTNKIGGVVDDDVDENETILTSSETGSNNSTLTCARNILANPYFHLIWATQVLYCWLNFIFGMVIVDFGKDRGLKSNQADTLIIYWATGQLIGRVILGMIIDLRLLSYKNYTILCLFIIASLTYLMVAIDNKSIQTEWYTIILSTIIIVLSAFIALLYLLFNGLMVTYVNDSLISMSIGISSFIGSFLLLPRANVIGYFRDNLNNYDAMINMLSLASLTFTLFWIIFPHLIQLSNELFILITTTATPTTSTTTDSINTGPYTNQIGRIKS